jgi:hypothetical protein
VPTPSKKRHRRQKQIKEILDAKHSGKGGSPEQQKLRDQQQQLRAEWDNVLVGSSWGTGLTRAVRLVCCCLRARMLPKRLARSLPSKPPSSTPCPAQRGKQRLQAEDGDKRTEREKLLSELRTLRDASRGPMSLEALDAKVAE